ncbi:MAG: NAD-dependent epimerase/dehydratase family protein [Collinsella sp.]
MRVLVTGARGFVGRNLCCALKNIRDGKDRRAKYQPLLPLEVMEYDVDSTPGELEDFCSRADFVFNLAGVNRPKDQSEFMEGNFGFASTLLDTLERHGNRCPVMLSSSAQASLSGRFEGSVYGESKLAGEGLFREYSERTGAPVLIYRFPNLYGKWCRPRYNGRGHLLRRHRERPPLHRERPLRGVELLTSTTSWTRCWRAAGTGAPLRLRGAREGRG